MTNVVAPQNSRFSVKHRPKLKSSPQIKISPDIWVIKKEMTSVTHIVSLKTMSNIYFVFKLATLNFPWWQPLLPLLTGLWRRTLAPGKVVPPTCFHQNDSEGCRIDHLDGLGHFCFGSGKTGKNSQGVVTTPLGKSKSNLSFGSVLRWIVPSLFLILLCSPFPCPIGSERLYRHPWVYFIWSVFQMCFVLNYHFYFIMLKLFFS